MSNNGTHEEAVLSTLHHALRANRRRIVIVILAEDPDQFVSVRDLAKQIAAREENVPLEQATGEPYRNAYNALSQTHLPMLSDADIIIYNSDRQIVTPGKQILAASMLVSLGTSVVQTLLREFPLDSPFCDRQSTIE